MIGKGSCYLGLESHIAWGYLDEEDDEQIEHNKYILDECAYLAKLIDLPSIPKQVLRKLLIKRRGWLMELATPTPALHLIAHTLGKLPLHAPGVYTIGINHSNYSVSSGNRHVYILCYWR